jgi:hypothetical protein
MAAADDRSESTSRRPRHPKPIPPGSVAAEHGELVDDRLKLDSVRTQHLEVGGIVISAGGGSLYQDDMFVMTMLQRSYGVVDAVIDLVDSFNLHAAAPLVRLQLDSLFLLGYALGWAAEKDRRSQREGG